ncbi:MAG: SDR family oxidoreductase [Alphaproteobacteria bacterium]|nr:SDR family oxidoreductase [Alphaproteobacteria bacterium]MCB9931221.1 SDR family oxidoreductase [Alphaproteobacteria bacterium]
MRDYTANRLFDLSGKVALVTGGSRGLGREMVRAFAQAGADVMIASRKLAQCEELADEIRAQTGRRAFPHAANVGDWSQVEAMVEAAYEHFGRVDVLVNNAGLSPLYPSLDDVGEDLFDKVFSVNLKGPFRAMAMVGKRMAAGEGGSIINVSSTASVNPNRTTAPYGAAKAALNHMTATFAQEYGPKVRVNCIIPGPFDTDISVGWFHSEAFAERAATRIALKRGGQPNEIVGAALYFASDASSFTTGTTLRVDGGSIG